MPSTRVKAAICRTSSGDCSRTRTLQQAPHPLQLPRCSMVGDPSRTSAARLEEPLEPPPQVVDSVRDPRERPREEHLQVVALAIADQAEGDLARGTEAAVGERVARRHPRQVDVRDRLAEAGVDRVDANTLPVSSPGTARLRAVLSGSARKPRPPLVRRTSARSSRPLRLASTITSGGGTPGASMKGKGRRTCARRATKAGALSVCPGRPTPTEARGSPQPAPLTSTKPTTSTDVLKRPSERAGSGGSARYVNVVWPPGGISPGTV